jgi:hypothetical protein
VAAVKQFVYNKNRNDLLFVAQMDHAKMVAGTGEGA